MVKEGTEFEVQDARTGEDITRSVLTQIIFEEEGQGPILLPIKFLRQLIRFYGDSLQAFVPGYLDMSMEGFTKNQGAMRDRIAEALGGGNQMVENLTRQNLQMFENAHGDVHALRRRRPRPAKAPSRRPNPPPNPMKSRTSRKRWKRCAASWPS